MNMTYEYKKITVQEILDRIAKGKIDSNAMFQRGLVASWLKVEKITRFYESIVSGGYIPPILYVTVENEIYQLVDGKQRVNAITNIHHSIGVSLPLNDEFYKRELDVVELRLDEDGILDLFEKLNREGVCLTSSQVMRGRFISTLQTSGLLNHVVWTAIYGKNKNQSEIESIILASNALLQGTLSLKGKSYIQLTIDKNIHDKLSVGLDRLDEILGMFLDEQSNIKTRMLKKCHIYVLAYVLALLPKFDKKSCFVTLKGFFGASGTERKTNRVEYDKNCHSNTSDTASLRVRIRTMFELCGYKMPKTWNAEASVPAAEASVPAESVPAESVPAESIPAAEVASVPAETSIPTAAFRTFIATNRKGSKLGDSVNAASAKHATEHFETALTGGLYKTWEVGGFQVKQINR